MDVLSLCKITTLLLVHRHRSFLSLYQKVISAKKEIQILLSLTFKNFIFLLYFKALLKRPSELGFIELKGIVDDIENEKNPWHKMWMSCNEGYCLHDIPKRLAVCHAKPERYISCNLFKKKIYLWYFFGFSFDIFKKNDTNNIYFQLKCLHQIEISNLTWHELTAVPHPMYPYNVTRKSSYLKTVIGRAILCIIQIPSSLQ